MVSQINPPLPKLLVFFFVSVFNHSRRKLEQILLPLSFTETIREMIIEALLASSGSTLKNILLGVIILND